MICYRFYRYTNLQIGCMLCKGTLRDRYTVVVERPEGGAQRVEIAGLDSTFIDVLARVEHLDGAVQTIRIKPGDSAFVVQAAPSALALSGTYLWLGIEHIWLGIDHLLFVFALLLIVSGWRRLVATITAFTLAHRITLVSAPLGWVQVSQQPVEAVIALSILFLATEIVHGLRGRPALTARQPWIVALCSACCSGSALPGRSPKWVCPSRRSRWRCFFSTSVSRLASSSSSRPATPSGGWRPCGPSSEP